MPSAPLQDGPPAPVDAAAAGGGRRRLVRHAALYLAIGGLSVGIDVGLLVLLAEVAGVPVGPAAATSFAVSVVANFGLNRLLAGRSGSQGLGRHALRYVALLLANMAITVAVVVGAQAAGSPYLVAKLLVVAASTAWNFVLYRVWVFADDPAPPATRDDRRR